MRRISLACRNSRHSRSSAFSLSAISVGTTAGLPLFTSAFFTHFSNVCPDQPIFAAMEVIAARRDGSPLSQSRTMRTGRLRTSGANLFAVLMIVGPSFQELGFRQSRGGSLNDKHSIPVSPSISMESLRPKNVNLLTFIIYAQL